MNGIAAGFQQILKQINIYKHYIGSHGIIKLDKENRIQEKKNLFYAYKKHLTQFLKMGSILFWVQFHAYHYIIVQWNIFIGV